MGLNNRQQKTYISIVDGKVSRRATESTPGAVKRTNAEGKEVYELHYTDIDGYLTSLSTREGKFGKEWVLVIESNGNEYQLSMAFSGGNAKGLLSALPNVDFHKPIIFVPWMKEVVNEDKTTSKRTAVYLHQIINGKEETVKWAFTKDEPNGLPDLVKVMFKGKEQWDDTERMLFFERMVADDIQIRIKDANITRGAGMVIPDEENVPSAEPIDDLPF